MKSFRIQSILAAAALAVLAGCASTPPEDPAVANLPRTQVTGEALRSLFVGQRMSSTRFGFVVQADFDQSGVVYGRVVNAAGNAPSDKGKWWITGANEVCIEWPGRFSINNGCVTVERRADGAYFARDVRNPANTQRIDMGLIQRGS